MTFVKRLLLAAPVLVLVFAASGAAARANPAPSRERVQTSREQTLQRVRAMLEDAEVRARLQAAGLDRQELEKRLDRLSDEQLEQLATQMDSLGVGASGLGIVIALLVIAALILLIIFMAQRV